MADDPRVFMQGDKSTWNWTAMILQPEFISRAHPEFISRAHVDVALEEVRRKKNPAALDRVRFDTLDEGESVQTLYLDPFSERTPSFNASTTPSAPPAKSSTASITKST